MNPPMGGSRGRRRSQWHRRVAGPQLSALRDGDLSRLKAAIWRWHLQRCQGCREDLDALDRQVLALQELLIAPKPAATNDDAAWRAIQAALRKDPPSRDVGRSTAMSPTGSRRPTLLSGLALRRLPVLVLGMSVAAVALLVVARPGRLFQHRPSDDVIISLAEEQFQKAEQPYQQARDRLIQVSERARERWAPEQQRAYDEALGGLRADTRRRLRDARQRPADVVAQERLYGAYRREIAFLQDSLFRGPSFVSSDVSRPKGVMARGVRAVSFDERGGEDGKWEDTAW